MRYSDLKAERDEAVARAIEAERLSMKSEFDRVTAEFEAELKQLRAERLEDAQHNYRVGLRDGLHMAKNELTTFMQNWVDVVERITPPLKKDPVPP